METRFLANDSVQKKSSEMTIRQKREWPDSSRPRGSGSKCFQQTLRLSAGFLSDEPIKSPYIPPLLMTDKPPGKLQSDLENESERERQSARRGAARLAAIASS